VFAPGEVIEIGERIVTFARVLKRPSLATCAISLLNALATFGWVAVHRREIGHPGDETDCLNPKAKASAVCGK
jgi:hypothetical protein